MPPLVRVMQMNYKAPKRSFATLGPCSMSPVLLALLCRIFASSILVRTAPFDFDNSIRYYPNL